jgi:plastocyanin domain-containing protein
MKTKIIAISILVTAILIAGTIMLVSRDKDSNGTISQTANNVSVADGKQIITIDAKGGYSPRVTTAKAGVPTIIKVNTHGTFDCSSSLIIPSLGYRKNLPPSGDTLIDVHTQQAGTSIRGLCAMGMYNFTINFN